MTSVETPILEVHKNRWKMGVGSIVLLQISEAVNPIFYNLASRYVHHIPSKPYIRERDKTLFRNIFEQKQPFLAIIEKIVGRTQGTSRVGRNWISNLRRLRFVMNIKSYTAPHARILSILGMCSAKTGNPGIASFMVQQFATTSFPILRTFFHNDIPVSYLQGRIQGEGCGECIPPPAIFNNALDK